MSQPLARRSHLDVADYGDVSVVTFVHRRIPDEEHVQATGDDLFRLIDERGRHKLLLDFGHIDYVSSALLGKVITLLRKLQAANGRLVLCRLNKDVLDLFRITKLRAILPTIDHPGLTTAEAVLREVFGYPERPVAFRPEWRTDTVMNLARQVRASGEFAVMPILADALQDAGCDADDLLAHLRDPDQPHVGECWAMEQILGRLNGRWTAPVT